MKIIFFIFGMLISLHLFAQPDTTATDDEIFVVVQNEPEFPGGIPELYKFIYAQIKYPSAALQAQVEGKVYVQFVIERDGSVSNCKVLRGLGFGLDEEAIRVIQLMPRWKPGSAGNGKPVRVQYILPIAFKLP